MTRLSPDDEALLAAAKAAAPTPRPTSSQTARRARALERAIGQHAERQRRAVPRRTVAAAALLVAGAASATTAWLASAVAVDVVAPVVAPAEAARARHPRDGFDGPITRSSDIVDPSNAPVVTAPEPLAATSAHRGSEDARPSTSKKRSTSPVRALRGGATAPPMTTAPPVAIAAAANDVAGEDAARAVVVAVQDVADGPASADVGPETVDDASIHEARELRDRCIDGLRARRDRAALDDCRVFGQRFPGHPAARALAFGAGGLAEALGLPRDAIAAYSRAILLSPLVGATWDDALLARARVYADVGELDEARADLRIYLHRSPESAGNADVERLRRALHLEP